jgi:hypothetical protein
MDLQLLKMKGRLQDPSMLDPFLSLMDRYTIANQLE